MRTCPYCGGTETKIVRVMGLAAFNIWDDVVCLACGKTWEKHSKIDKISSKRNTTREKE